jgi:hypothetical protein
MFPFGRGTAKIIKSEGILCAVNNHMPLCRACAASSGEISMIQLWSYSKVWVGTVWACSVTFWILQRFLRNYVGSSRAVSPFEDEANNAIC